MDFIPDNEGKHFDAKLDERGVDGQPCRAQLQQAPRETMPEPNKKMVSIESVISLRFCAGIKGRGSST
jgi:hypothetical protein